MDIVNLLEMFTRRGEKGVRLLAAEYMLLIVFILISAAVAFTGILAGMVKVP